MVEVMKTNQMIVDYFEMTYRLGDLDFGEFIALWETADAIAVDFYAPEEPLGD